MNHDFPQRDSYLIIEATSTSKVVEKNAKHKHILTHWL